MANQVITFRINPGIKAAFQSAVFKHKIGQMPELLRQALNELATQDLPIARQYVSMAQFGKQFSVLDIDDSAQQVMYSVNIDSKIKQKIETMLSNDKDVQASIKSISNFCRCVCEALVYKLRGPNDLTAPKLEVNPLIINNLVEYTIVARHHFEKHTVDVFVPGLPANDYMAMGVSAIRPNTNPSDAIIAQNEAVIVDELRQAFADKLTNALMSLPSGSKPKSYKLQGILLGDNCESFNIRFDLEQLAEYKAGLAKADARNNKEILQVAFSKENARYLDNKSNLDGFLNDLVTQYRRTH